MQLGKHNLVQFTFSYKLSGHGWANTSVSDGNNKLNMCISYLSDALGDLARAVISLFYGGSGSLVSCSWQDEPGEYRWTMQREGEVVSLRILRFEDCFSRKDDDKGHRLFGTECSLIRLATQVKGQMHQLHNEFGEAGYKEHWVSHDFPTVEFTRLTELIQEHKQSLSLAKEGTQ